MKALPFLALSIVALVYLTAASTLAARTWYILPDGTGDAQTIQADIDSAVARNVVKVACGTYFKGGPPPTVALPEIVMAQLGSDAERSQVVALSLGVHGRPPVYLARSSTSTLARPPRDLPFRTDESFLRVLPNTSGSLWGNSVWGPAVGDCNGDGELEIFFLRVDGFLHGLDALGQDLPGFPIDLVALSNGNYADSTTGHVVALGDLDGNGSLEIVCSIRPGNYVPSHLFVFELDGSLYPGWPATGLQIATINHSSCTIRDIDQDGTCEIITGGTNLGGDGTYIYVLRDDGTSLNAHFPYRIIDSLSMTSTIAVGDLDGDDWEELVFVANDFQVHALNHQDATELPGWPLPLNGFRSDVALGDIDGDGNLEVVVIEDNATPGRVHVLHSDGTALPNWPQEFPGCGCAAGGPSLFDLDEDGRLEIIFGSSGQVNVLRHDGTPYPGWPQLTDGAPIINSCVTVASLASRSLPILVHMIHGDFLYAWDAAGRSMPGFPVDFSVPNYATNCWATPVIADLQGDGDPDLVIALFQNSLVLDNHAEIHALDLQGEFILHWRDWAAYHKDNAHTGLVPLPEPTAVAPTSLLSPRITSHPNPFNPQTAISFSVDRPQRVSINVFDMTGRRVAVVTDQVYGTGSHSADWNGKDSSDRAVSSGTYLVRMETADRVESQKIMLVR